jgi:hypothetical protein
LQRGLLTAALERLYDPDILCGPCDGRLGLLDDYAVKVCRDFKSRHTRDGILFEVPDIDCDKLAKFVLAVLWCASISSRPHFAAIRLGPDENKARDVLFGASPIRALPAFQVTVNRYESARTNVEGFYSHSVRHRIPHTPRNRYSFSAGGFHCVAKLDARPLPKSVAPLALSGRGAFRGEFQKLEESEFHSAAVDMIADDHARKPPPT